MTETSKSENFLDVFQTIAGQEEPRPPQRERVDMEACLKDYRECKKGLINGAAAARENAVSHRNFKVGCALMAVDAETGEGEYGIYMGYNVKPKPDEELKSVEGEKRKGEEKRCAERNTIEAALQGANAVIIAIVTVSREHMTGDATERKTVASKHKVLHPCLDCRNMLRELLRKGVIKKETVICNVNDEKGLEKKEEEEQTVDQLLRRYAKADKQKVA